MQTFAALEPRTISVFRLSLVIWVPGTIPGFMDDVLYYLLPRGTLEVQGKYRLE